jgi:hypothetical protein
MDKKAAYMRVMQKFGEYAALRLSDTKKGLETRQLAALLVQKYGLGLSDAYAAVFEDAIVPDAML